MNPIHSSRAAIVASVAAILLTSACWAPASATQSDPTTIPGYPPPADGGNTGSADASPSADAAPFVDAFVSDDAGEPDAPHSADDDATVDAVDAAPITIPVSDAGTASVDIVSPARCEDRLAHLLDCVIPSTTVEGGVVADAGSFETVLTVVHSGDCSSQYPLILKLDAVGMIETLFHLEDGTATVRRTDGAAIDALVLTDASSWTGAAVYEDSCRMSIAVQMNEPANE